MKIEFDLTEQEAVLLGKLMKYEPTIKGEELIEDEETGLSHLEPTETPNPYTLQQYIRLQIIGYKDAWIEKALEVQVKKIAEETKAKLTDPTHLKAITEAVKANGIESLITILKAQI